MNQISLHRPFAAATSLLLAALLAACGGSPPPVALQKPAEAKEAPPPEPEADKAQAGNAEAIELCIATANAKRAKFSGEPPKITVKHVLVKYKGAKKADDTIKRSREEACLRALEVRDKIREGGDFDEIVKQYSEEPGAATRGGSIGAIERADVAKPFADAAFDLSINQLSDIVETEFGFHVIWRTE
jgi:parvulin-like peptidyl-prolyl isomerase